MYAIRSYYDIVGALQLALWSTIFSFMFVDLFDSLVV